MANRHHRKRRRQACAARWRRLIVEQYESRLLLANHPPVAVDRSSQASGCDGYVAISTGPGVSPYFATDADGDSLTLEIVSPPTSGTLSFQSNGMLTYNRPAGPGFNGFTYRAFDGQAYSNVATFSFTPQITNCPPQAATDDYATLENTPLTVTTPQPAGFAGRGVLANDFDLDSTNVTARVLSGPSHAKSFTLNADGTFNYVPTDNFYGSDSFKYLPDDGINHTYIPTTPGTVTITVARVNQPPVANDEVYSDLSDSTLSLPAPGILGNDGDVDGDPLTAVLVTPPQHGTLSLNADGSFSYAATSGFTDPETFTYRPSDGKSLGNPATVTLRLAPVTATPVAVSDSYSIDQYSQLVVDNTGGPIRGVLANDIVAAGVIATAQLITAPFHGNLTLNSDGSFTYLPLSTFYGTESFVYQVLDNGVENHLGNYATVSINVRHVNTAPIANGDMFFPQLCTSAYIAAAPGVLGNDMDVDGDPLTAVMVPGSATGSISLNPDGGFTAFGYVNFAYYVTDGHSTSNVANVIWGNYPPGHQCSPELPLVAASDSFAGGATISVPAPGVLANDTNYGTSALTAVLFTGPAHGSVRLNADGSFVYIGAPGYSGPDNFRYYNRGNGDSSYPATVSLTTTAGNHAPFATNSTYNATLDTPFSLAAPGVLTGSTDADGNTLLAVVATLPSHGQLDLHGDGSFLYTPVTDYLGPDSFTFFANDGQANSPTSNTVTINVAPANHSPSGTNKTITLLSDNAVYTFSPADFGFGDPQDAPANNLLGIRIVSTPTAGIFIDDTAVVTLGQFIPAADLTAGKLRFFPDAGASGVPYVRFVFQAQDDGGTVSGGIDTDPMPKTISINVAAVNQPPAGADHTVVVQYSSGYYFTAADFGFSDNQQYPPNHFSSVQITTVPAAGTLKDGDSAVVPGQFISVADFQSYKVIFTPASGGIASPYTSFTFQVRDDGGTANGSSDLDPTPRTMTINTAVVNHAPSGSGGEITLMENGSYSFSSNVFGFYDVYDSPSDLFVGVKIMTLPQKGTLSFGFQPVAAGDFIPTPSLGNLRYTPETYGSGFYYSSFAFQVKDSGGTANGGVDLDPNPDLIQFDVLHVNQSPQGTDRTVTTSPNSGYVFSIADFGFTDPYDSPPYIDYPPPNNFLGVWINSLPAAGSLSLASQSVTVPQFVTAQDISAGKLKFSPAANAVGSSYASFTFRVKDDGGTALFGFDVDPTPNTITINVPPVNHPPSGADGTVTTLEDTAYEFKTTDFPLTDPNDQPPNALQAVKIASLPLNGSLTFNNQPVVIGQFITATDLQLSQLKFLPAANANGPTYAKFTFQVQDDGGTADGGIDVDPSPNTITIDVTPVNDPPAGANRSVLMAEDTIYVISPSDFGFSDPSDSPANSMLAVKITTLPSLGTLRMNGQPMTAGQIISAAAIAAGSLTYLPPLDSPTQTSFTFQLQDNGGTANGGQDTDPSPNTIAFTIVMVCGRPVFGIDTTVVTAEDLPYVFRNTDFSLFGDGPDIASSTVKIFTLPAVGVLKLNGVEVAAGQIISAADIDRGLLRYTPPPNLNGTALASFEATTDDGDGCGTWSTGTITINVAAVNDPPKGGDTGVSNEENHPNIFEIADFHFLDQSDMPGNAFLAVKLTTLPNIGKIYDRGVPVVAGQFIPAADIAAGQLWFNTGIPSSSFNGGIASFDFQVQDDGGTLNGGVDLDPISRSFTIPIYRFWDHGSAYLPYGIDKTVERLEGQPDYAFTQEDFSGVPIKAVKVVSVSGVGSLTNNGVPITVGQFISAADIDRGLFRASVPSDFIGDGAVRFVFQAEDDQGTDYNRDDLAPSPNTFTINVTPVNDSPSFNHLPGNYSATDENPQTHGPASQQCLPSWATDMIPGPADESGQTVSFIVTSTNPNLFTVQPKVNADGSLCYTPKPNIAGTATIGVTLQDSEGATSPTVSFNIQITKPHPLHNTLNRYDVSGSLFSAPDGVISAGDALTGINYINAKGSGPIPSNTPPGPPYPDVNADDSVAADDVLEIINWINSHSELAESEAPGNEVSLASDASATNPADIASQPAIYADLLNMLAADAASAQLKRRRLAS